MPETLASSKYFHLLEPDYSRPVLSLSEEQSKSIMDKVRFLYGEEKCEEIFAEIERLMQVYYAYKTSEMIAWETTIGGHGHFSEKDVILITYGDLVYSEQEKPLETLARLCNEYLKGVFNTLHILPFYPYSSDRGFSVTDFEEVDPNLGTWDDILDLKMDFRLMFDGVFNHVSSKSRWFQEFLNQNPDFTDFFTVFSTKSEISADYLKLIVRPRTSDILTEFKTLYGPRLVWTTFSPDQIDLNFKNPEVTLKMIGILLLYVRRGADVIRLDAVTYLWEELGTSCVHLDQSHMLIKLFRSILDIVAPHVALITETNVAHSDNIRYFGNGFDEAQMVYNFALPPLVLHTFQTGDATKLSRWADGLEPVSTAATYFNFLDSHDGIGVMAVKGILSDQEIEMMSLRVLEHGGYISYKAEGDGKETPYELNITWYSAINREDLDEPDEMKLKRYLASRAIAMVMMGVPGIYLHGLLGSQNDAEAVISEAERRSINRTRIGCAQLESALEDENSNIYQISSHLVRLIYRRIREKAFHPQAAQKILQLSAQIFALLRTSIDGEEQILALICITDKTVAVDIDMKGMKTQSGVWTDILTKRNYKVKEDRLDLTLAPYEIIWLKNALAV